MTIWVKGDETPIDLAFEKWFIRFGIHSFIIEAKWPAGYKAIIDGFNEYYKARGTKKTMKQLRKSVSLHGSKYRGELVQEHKNSLRKLGDANKHEKGQQRMYLIKST